MTAISCAQAEVLMATSAIAVTAEPDPGLLAHLEGCDACLRLMRELENPVVADALAEACGAATDLDAFTVVPRDHYLRGKEIGRGGMGRIVRARDRRLGRSVAIKELLHERLAARFEREARLTARLQHPAIVSVHEAGRWPSGEPFYAMKYVAGKPLDREIAERSGLAERLALLPNFIAVVEAMAYAHSERVIHRDLKPHNILIGAFGETVVIDWGLAKDLGVAEALEPGWPYRGDGLAFTAGGAGTPGYMAPEQTRGEEPDERVDVYALGATLHHLLAGAPPAKAELPVETPADLRAIVVKATASSPAARYPSAAELAEELKRFQTGQLVNAHRYTLSELVVRWLRRHRALVTLAGASATILAIVAVVAVTRIVRARAEAERTTGELLAERGRQELLANRSAAALAFLDGAMRRGIDTPALRFLIADATRHLGRLVDSFPLGDDAVRVVPSPDGTRLLVTYTDARARVFDLASHGVLEAMPAPAGTKISGFAPDGRAYLVAGCPTAEPAAAGRCGRTVIVSRGGRTRALTHDGEVAAAEFTADGKSITTLADDRVYVWGENDTEPRVVWKPPGELRAAAGSRGGDVVAAATSDGIFVREQGVERILVPDPSSCDSNRYQWDLRFDLADERIVVSTTKHVCAWDLRTGALVARSDPKLRTATALSNLHLAFSPDGAWLVTFNGYSTPQLWRGDTLAAGSPMGETVGVAYAGFAPGVLLTGSPDGIASIWDLRGEELGRFEGSGRALRRVWLTVDAARLAAWDADNVVHIWDASRYLRGPFLPRMTPSSLPFLSDGKMLFVSQLDGSVQLWDRRGPIAALRGPSKVEDPSRGRARPNPDGPGVLVGDPDGRLLRWDPATGAIQTLVELARAPRAWLTSHGDRWIAASGDKWTIYDGQGRLLASLPDVFRRGAILSPDDRHMAAIVDGEIRLWDVASGRQTLALRAEHGFRPERFSPDGTLLAWSQGDGTGRSQGLRVRLTDVMTGADRATLEGGHPAGGELFAPDSSRLLSFAPTGAATLRSLHGEVLASYDGHQGGPATAAFSPDGRLLAIGGGDGVVRVWDGDVLVQTTSLRGPIRRVAFSPDGDELFAADDGAGWRWSVTRDRRSPEEIHAFVTARVPFRLEAGKIAPAPARSVRPEPAQAAGPAALGPVVTIPCPPGAAPLGAPFPFGRAAWCVRPDGTFHGPLRIWNAMGVVVIDDEYEEDRRL